MVTEGASGRALHDGLLVRTALVVARYWRAVAASTCAVVAGQLPFCKDMFEITRVSSGGNEPPVKPRLQVAVFTNLPKLYVDCV